MKRLLLIIAALSASISMFSQGMYQPQNGMMHPVPPAVPEYMVFAGDTIRFDTTEKYERMDRELMSFTYMHTTSTLML